MERLSYRDLYKGYELNDTVNIRELSDNVMIPRSTLSDNFKTPLRRLSAELYCSVHKILLQNKQKYFRGYIC